MAEHDNKRLGRILKMSVRDVRALEGSAPPANAPEEAKTDPQTGKPLQDTGEAPSTYDLSG